MSNANTEYGKARAEEAKGTGGSMAENLKAKGYEAKAGIKETFGYDATEDRARAAMHNAGAQKEQVAGNVKGAVHDTRGKIDEKLGTH